jgi:hypothetical protein
MTSSTIYYSTNYHGRIMELDLGFNIVVDSANRALVGLQQTFFGELNLSFTRLMAGM